MYTRILVPLDGSDLAAQVLPYVLSLGKTLKARVELLNVISPLAGAEADSDARDGSWGA